jgi:hypothetical protein
VKKNAIRENGAPRLPSTRGRQKQIPRCARDDKISIFGNPLEEEFRGDVEAAAEAERGKLETRRQKLEIGKSKIEIGN